MEVEIIELKVHSVTTIICCTLNTTNVSHVLSGNQEKV